MYIKTPPPDSTSFFREKGLGLFQQLFFLAFMFLVNPLIVTVMRSIVTVAFLMFALHLLLLLLPVDGFQWTC